MHACLDAHGLLPQHLDAVWSQPSFHQILNTEWTNLDVLLLQGAPIYYPRTVVLDVSGATGGEKLRGTWQAAGQKLSSLGQQVDGIPQGMSWHLCVIDCCITNVAFQASPSAQMQKVGFERALSKV